MWGSELDGSQLKTWGRVRIGGWGLELLRHGIEGLIVSNPDPPKSTKLPNYQVQSKYVGCLGTPKLDLVLWMAPLFSGPLRRMHAYGLKLWV